jgi:peptidoglycan/xylan/chitin deacetylase (PgdA/CDA1 family)
MAGQMLDLAKAAQAPITVFAVGNWLEAAPAIGNRILAEGHELGNHTYTHPALGSLTAAGVADEIDRCVQVLQSVQGNNGRWFRPSGIDIPTPTILDQVGKAGYFQSIGWDIDPLDYNEPGGPAVVSIVTAGLKPGSIISLHFGYQSSLDAFPQIVSAIRAKGLQPMLLRDLLG